MANIKPILPGEILEDEFLIPMGISSYKLAKDINISATREKFNQLVMNNTGEAGAAGYRKL